MRKDTVGGTSGYWSGTRIASSNRPPENGVSSGPCSGRRCNVTHHATSSYQAANACCATAAHLDHGLPHVYVTLIGNELDASAGFCLCCLFVLLRCTTNWSAAGRRPAYASCGSAAPTKAILGTYSATSGTQTYPEQSRASAHGLPSSRCSMRYKGIVPDVGAAGWPSVKLATGIASARCLSWFWSAYSRNVDAVSRRSMRSDCKRSTVPGAGSWLGSLGAPCQQHLEACQSLATSRAIYHCLHLSRRHHRVACSLRFIVCQIVCTARYSLTALNYHAYWRQRMLCSLGAIHRR